MEACWDWISLALGLKNVATSSSNLLLAGVLGLLGVAGLDPAGLGGGLEGVLSQQSIR